MWDLNKKCSQTVKVPLSGFIWTMWDLNELAIELIELEKKFYLNYVGFKHALIEHFWATLLVLSELCGI